MSAVFGIVDLFGGSVGLDDMEVMAEALKHRAHHGRRFEIWSSVAFGHCKLCSTPESLAENLPYRDKDSSLALTADARIDNREYLIVTLRLDGKNSTAISDSQLILAAFKKWGAKCVDHLIGDFVFAIWNESSRTLFLARDHLGCKPLHYAIDGGKIYFASTSSAISNLKSTSVTLNRGRVIDRILDESECIEKTTTFFNEVTSLPPAHVLLITRDSIDISRYWELSGDKRIEFSSDEQYVEAFTKIYEEAVRVRMRSSSSVGSMLSGGLDSSTICALARDLSAREGKQRLRTFSAALRDANGCRESENISAVLAHGEFDPTLVTEKDVDAWLAELLDYQMNMEDPSDSGSILLSMMFLLAGRSGCSALLDGLDGDLATGLGWGYVVPLLKQGKFSLAWREIKGYSNTTCRGDPGALALAYGSLRSLLIPGWLRELRHRLTVGRRYRPWIYERGLSKFLSNDMRLPHKLAKANKALRTEGSVDPCLGHIQRLEKQYLTAGVEHYERLGSYFGVEARHPLLDVRLLEFAVAVPWDQKSRFGWQKFLLRRVAADRLPASVAWRKGSEVLGLDYCHRFLSQVLSSKGGLSPVIESQIGEYLRNDFVGALEEECHIGRSVGLKGDDFARRQAQLWDLYTLGIWHKREAVGGVKTV
ncbi:MAG: asparagine synthase-related protein [Halioglobus sp.]